LDKHIGRTSLIEREQKN
jgi:SNF2 family DNA or RNA helicase